MKSGDRQQVHQSRRRERSLEVPVHAAASPHHQRIHQRRPRAVEPGRRPREGIPHPELDAAHPAPRCSSPSRRRCHRARSVVVCLASTLPRSQSTCPASSASPRRKRAVMLPRHPARSGSTDAMPPSSVSGSSSSDLQRHPARRQLGGTPVLLAMARHDADPDAHRQPSPRTRRHSRRCTIATIPVTIIPPARAQKCERPVARPAPKQNTTSITGGGITPCPPSSTWDSAAPSTPSGTPP